MRFGEIHSNFLSELSHNKEDVGSRVVIERLPLESSIISFN